MDKSSFRSFSFVIGSQYFLYFGVMGIFLPFFNLYCYHLDFSGFQIGIISATRSVVMVLFPLLWGALADRFQIRRPLYILCSFISTMLWIFFFYTSNFMPMLAITFFYAIFYAPIISFLEAFTMDVLGTEKKKYGQTRLWGSIAFIAIALAMGRAIDMFTINIIVVLIFWGSLVQARFWWTQTERHGTFQPSWSLRAKSSNTPSPCFMAQRGRITIRAAGAET